MLDHNFIVIDSNNKIGLSKELKLHHLLLSAFSQVAENIGEKDDEFDLIEEWDE